MESLEPGVVGAVAKAQTEASVRPERTQLDRELCTWDTAASAPSRHVLVPET